MAGYTRINEGQQHNNIGILSFIRWQAYLYRHYLLHIIHDIKKNKVNYFLGFFACFLVVFVVSLVVTIIGNTPVVFLRLAELQVGETDMRVSGNYYSRSWADTLNYSLVDQILSKEKRYTYHAPRYAINDVAIVPQQACKANLDPYDTQWKYRPNGCLDCFFKACPFDEIQTDLYVIDTERENRMEYGRGWTLPPVEAGQIYVHSALARELGVSIGDIVFLNFNIRATFADIWTRTLASNSYYVRPDILYAAQQLYIPLEVAAIFSSANGKFGSGQDVATIVEYSNFLPYIASTLDPSLGEDIIQHINRSNLYEHAQHINFNLPPSRVPTYIDTDQEAITNTVVQWASQVLYRIGFSVVHARLIVLEELSDSAIISLFLGLILNIIVFILLFLSIILIYSLLMINVETKTFEMGVMRMIGITRTGLVQLLLLQACSYSIPSWVLGLILSQFFGIFVSKWFLGLTGVPINPKLTSDAVLMASGLGLMIPVVASILPIRNALGQNLHDSLDTNRSKTSAVQVTIDRAEDNTVSFPLIIVGLALSGFGFGVYYVFPLSLLAMNFALLLNMFFFLLIGMLFGMVLLSLNIGQILETIIVWVFFFWENASIPQVVLKNLVAHRLRNRKTTIMYALSLGFIIFINVTYQMQESSMTYQTQQENGAFIKIHVNPDASGAYRIISKDRLELMANNNPIVEGFAWVSRPLQVMSNSENEISNLGHLYRDGTSVYGVSPNIFKITIPGFLNVHEVVKDPDINLASSDELAYQLYSEEGSKSMIIGTRYKNFLGLKKKNSHLLLDTTSNATTHTRLKPMAFLDSAPIFTFSKFPSVSSQSSLVSFTTYVRLSNGSIPSVDSIRMGMFLIKMKSSATDTEKDDLLASLKSLTRGYAEVWVFDYRKVASPLATASVVLQYFFQFTTVVAMLISFFSLMSSMFTNIHEQVKEIGILRAIGISKGAMYRVYMYEAFVLVFASSLQGILIGTAVGYTVLLQRILFTQLPIPFIFPTQLLLVVFISSIIFAVMAAFGPIRNVVAKPIVNTLRGG